MEEIGFCLSCPFIVKFALSHVSRVSMDVSHIKHVYMLRKLFDFLFIPELVPLK
jgi:hypothetical protein